MNFSKLRAAKLEALTVVCLLLPFLTYSVVCQVTDGDDQFQVYHQDIGRLSGGATNSPVAPQLVIRQQAPTTAPVAPIIEQAAPQRGRHHQHINKPQHQARRPAASRAALSVRTRAPVTASVAEPVATVPTYSEPALFVPQQQSHYQTPTLQHQPLSRSPPQGAPVEPQFQSAAPGPALSSFRSSQGHSNSVTARHSALMAQVAAERQAAAALSGDYSPLEALASPAVAQVQPPPTLNQPTAAASPALTFVNQPKEPLVAPSFDHVLGNGCPHKGVFSYPNKDHCDRYYMCTNGTFTEEACPNGLAYGQMGAVYQHCAYNWNVDCGTKKTSEPISSPGCPWQFGIFPITSNGRCSLDYFVCEWGVPETKRCSPEGLFYDDRIKGCQWADQLGCKSEAVLNFKCPPEDEDNPYWPYPRYYHTKQDVVVCVNEQPRLVHCNEDQIVEPSSLACVDLIKKKKKF